MDLLVVEDIAEDLSALLALAQRVKTDPREGHHLQGRKVGLFFMKPSTRTRVSSEVATVETGAHPVVLSEQEVGLGSRESAADVARVLDRYLDLLAFRVFSHGDLESLAQYAEAPVVNLLSDLEHPCQALADLVTISEHRKLAGCKIAYLGDGNNVCHSLMAASSIVGAEMVAITPPEHTPSPEYVRRWGTEVANTADAVEGADVVYTDVWVSMGEEPKGDRSLEPFRVDEALFDRAADEAIFLHCLPAHRGQEVTAAVMEHPRSRVFDQAENRLHTFKAVLLHLLR